MADVDDLESEESINSPEYSPISDTAESHQDSTTHDISEDEPEPQTETEPSVSNLSLFVHLVRAEM